MVWSHTGRENRQIVGLDLVRFGAALLVMVHHLGWRVWYQDYAAPMSYHYLEPFARPGFVGVEIFFVLSGLVIAYTAARATSRTFFESRLLRLAPAAWICSTLTILIVYAMHQQHMQLGGVPFTFQLGRRWFDSLFFAPKGPWVDGSFWTLCVECGFYLQVLVLLLLGRFRWIGAWMTCFGLFTSLLVILVRVLSFHPIPYPSVTHFVLASTNAVAYWDMNLRHAQFFAIGVLLWLCRYKGVTWRRVLALVLLLPGCLVEIRNRAEWNFFWWQAELYWILAMVLIVLSLRYNDALHSCLGERGAKLARRLGLVTYPLYLLHQVAGYALLRTLRPYLPDLLNLATVITILLLTAFAVHHLLETPLQRLFRRSLFRGDTLPKAPATTVP